MKKCRYSINGKCTNENVACEKCNSTDHEMKACAPLQKCIIIYDDNWIIDVPEYDNKQMKRYNREIMEAARQRLGLEKSDTSRDEYIMSLDKRTVFREYCEWNGLLGWSDNILSAIEYIFDIRLGMGSKEI